jgi:hypothetical protein
MSKVQQAFTILCSNKQFLTSIEAAIENIIMNTENDDIDITDIIFIITTAYNNFPTMKVDQSDLPQLLEKLFIFVVKKYNLMNSSELKLAKTKLNSAIKLTMLQPNFHKLEEGVSLFKKIFWCLK